MHVDRVLEAATIEDEAEDGPAGMEGFNEAVSEARESASVKFIRKKSCCYCVLYSVLSIHSPGVPWRQGTIYTLLENEQ